MFLILFRSIKLSIIGIIPNIFASSFILGFIGLLGIRLVRSFMNVNPAVKHRTRILIKNTVKIFVAIAMWLVMIYDHVMVDELLAFGEIKSVQHGFQSRAIEMCSDIVASNAPAERDGMVCRMTVATYRRVKSGYMKSGNTFVLKLYMFDLCVVPCR